jgi:4-amino-4-deoxy-L-arabinose transferase-like glycosyltransferase
MTEQTDPIVAPSVERLDPMRDSVSERPRGFRLDTTWVPVAFLSVLTLAAVLYIWNLTVSDYANTYYSAAALAASQSWPAWFFGSFDANNFITVDKPPLSTMVMGLSVRIFGLSSWSILLPEALAGVVTVGVLFLTVKRAFGPAAAAISGVVMALTPAAVLVFRFNNPDALLTLLLVLSAWAMLHSIEKGSLRWVMLASTFVGLAFLTKYLQGYEVLPEYALVFGLSANTTLRRRIGGLFLALAMTFVVSGWWVAIVQLLPADMRPFIGGSTTGSPLDLIFGYDGLGRIFGATDPGGNGANFSGTVGLLRLFNNQMFGQIAWFIPLALFCLVVGLWHRRWSHRTDLALASYLLWGGWFVVTAVVFSYMSGIIHSYYTVALAPAVAALVGAGLTDLWKARLRAWVGGLAVGLACLATAWFSAQLLDRTAGFAPGVGQAAIVLAAVGLVALAIVSLPSVNASVWARRLGMGAAALGLAATLLAPGAYAWTTMQTSYNGDDPHPGPGTASPSDIAGPNGLGTTTFTPGSGAGGFGGQLPGSGVADGNQGRFGGGTATSGSGDTALFNYLVANRGTALWIVAANGASQAASIELATGLPVMAMGGFTGSDPAPTLAQLQSYIAAGKLRFVLLDGSSGGTFGDLGASWVMTYCTVVSVTPTSGGSLYDCSGTGT